MHSNFRCLAALAVAVCAAAASPALQAAPTFVYSSGTSAYYLTERAATWTDSEAAAVAFGGHLVAINDAAEQAELTANFGNTQRLWIGLNDVAQEGSFAWSNGDALTFTNWTVGEPNNWSNIEDYGSMNWVSGSNTWNDLPNGGFGAGTLTPMFGIIEISRSNVPEPGALSLAALGLAAAGFVRRRRQRT